MQYTFHVLFLLFALTFISDSLFADYFLQDNWKLVEQLEDNDIEEEKEEKEVDEYLNYLFGSTFQEIDTKHITIQYYRKWKIPFIDILTPPPNFI